MAYVFDTSPILEAKNRYYSFDICPAFWDWLVLERKRGNVLSINAVKKELVDPDAAGWAKANPIFFDDDDDSRLTEVSDWVQNEGRFTQPERASFLSGADPRLISYALVGKHIIVTHERSAPLSQSVKIPDVCYALGVSVIDTFALLQLLNAKFILETED